MTSTLSVAAIQLTSTDNWRDNLDTVKSLVNCCAEEGAELVVLPENVFLFDGKNMRALAQSSDQQIILDSITELATSLGIYLVVGSHPMLYSEDNHAVVGDRVRQSCLAISPQGELVSRYDKIHLFDVDVDDKAASYRESSVIEKGELTPKVIDVNGFKVGLSICYDLRFPELYRELTQLGAELLLVPAAFTYVTGKAHWNTLLAARAIENQCFVLGVNQCGWHNATRQTYGHSSLYSPNGERLTGLEGESGYFVCHIDKESLISQRSKMPCFSHRRF
ncbi:carbon-nitrogen hydrolase family protein [Marinomonas sp. C2222]|uniref:Carbon-nitrogen hydrolase family protein n=1 Tax=Marinomonas sargassi TaxID=2984494 RepID=A0ABT2YTF4_9GAMM|nr:carbon-nitrogen hydrolase family protein [Marinomonas sargassi]MCV2402899.1 carbon-nitrogen hydrolase family protein [Marinomonas sargassi]